MSNNRSTIVNEIATLVTEFNIRKEYFNRKSDPFVSIA